MKFLYMLGSPCVAIITFQLNSVVLSFYRFNENIFYTGDNNFLRECKSFEGGVRVRVPNSVLGYEKYCYSYAHNKS